LKGCDILKIKLRLEETKDIRAVDLLTRAAFWREERIESLGIGCDEHYLTHLFRKSKDGIKELNIVAEIDGKIVGNIMYSHAYILRPDNSHYPVINFGPLSVLPSFQKTGVGSALMRYSIEKAKELGYGAILFFGHPTYYPRFGFKEAKDFDITTKEGKNYPAFMAMELIDGNLKGVNGKFIESEVFDMLIDEVIEFDKNLVTEEKI